MKGLGRTVRQGSRIQRPNVLRALLQNVTRMLSKPRQDSAKVAFVRASGHRSSVIISLQDWPKTTGQVALACSLSAAHASRTLRELVEQGLAECQTPELRGRGRLYGLTDLGLATAGDIEASGRSRLHVPLVRGTHPAALFRALTARYGRDAAEEPFFEIGLTPPGTAALPAWMPLQSLLALLEAIEARFGDGTYVHMRELAAEAVPFYPSARRYVWRALPLRVLVDLVPSAYLRDFNHGRVEVEVSESGARFKQYDWLSSRPDALGGMGAIKERSRLGGLTHR